jgi:hypothetical protein
MMHRVRKTIITLALSLIAALGLVAAVGMPSSAQITITCWKESCVKDPTTNQTACIRVTIPCPEEEEEVRTP